MDARTADSLLAHACNHLGDVDGGAFGAAQCHDEWAVVSWQVSQAFFSDVLAHAAQDAKDAILQGLLCRAAGQQLQLAGFVLRDEGFAVDIAFMHLCGDKRPRMSWSGCMRNGTARRAFFIFSLMRLSSGVTSLMPMLKPCVPMKRALSLAILFMALAATSGE